MPTLPEIMFGLQLVGPPYGQSLGIHIYFLSSLVFGNVVKVSSNKEELEFNMDIEGRRIESSVETVRERTRYSAKKKELEKEMHKLYMNIVRVKEMVRPKDIKTSYPSIKK